MARTFSEGLSYAADRVAKTREARRLSESDQLERALKLGELQTKGINITEQQTPRKLFGFIPAGSQRSLSMNYDPTMNPSYAKDQSVIEKNRAQTQKDLAKAASLGKDNNLTVGQRTARDKAVTDIYTATEANKVNRNTIDKALDGSENVPSGFTGKARLGIAKALPGLKKLVGVNDKMIEDAQELKMALTSGTLAETAHTKGAISDSEMMLFKEASANDDFNSPAIQPVLRKMRAFIDAGEAGMYGAYQKNYGEDPRTWFENNQAQSFNTVEEAEASGVKGPVLIGGKKAIIE